MQSMMIINVILELWYSMFPIVYCEIEFTMKNDVAQRVVSSH